MIVSAQALSSAAEATWNENRDSPALQYQAVLPPLAGSHCAYRPSTDGYPGASVMGAGREHRSVRWQPSAVGAFWVVRQLRGPTKPGPAASMENSRMDWQAAVSLNTHRSLRVDSPSAARNRSSGEEEPGFLIDDC